jgi:hypothetical protein
MMNAAVKKTPEDFAREKRDARAKAKAKTAERVAKERLEALLALQLKQEREREESEAALTRQRWSSQPWRSPNMVTITLKFHLTRCEVSLQLPQEKRPPQPSQAHANMASGADADGITTHGSTLNVNPDAPQVPPVQAQHSLEATEAIATTAQLMMDSAARKQNSPMQAIGRRGAKATGDGSCSCVAIEMERTFAVVSL